jgi:alkanesulfonate monooxygenase SsuD/methylene tetrahydromethanopterin reductase-like flavin-dependent oxidoreductase (luciferase family)
MALAIIGGAPERFKPMVDLYRQTAARSGVPPTSPAVSINSHGFLARDSREAADLAYPPYAETMDRIGRERGWPPQSRAHFDAEAGLRGASFVGSPQQVIDKILYQHEIFRHDRFLIQLTVGPMPHTRVLEAIELLGTEVAPVVRRETTPAATPTEGQGRSASPATSA